MLTAASPAPTTIVAPPGPPVPAPDRRPACRREISRFAMVPTEIAAYRGLSAQAKLLWGVLFGYAQRGLRPARRDLAADLGASSATVKRSLRELFSERLAEAEPVPGGARAYRLFLPAALLREWPRERISASRLARNDAGPGSGPGVGSNLTPGGVENDPGGGSKMTRPPSPETALSSYASGPPEAGASGTLNRVYIAAAEPPPREGPGGAGSRRGGIQPPGGAVRRDVGPGCASGGASCERAELLKRLWRPKWEDRLGRVATGELAYRVLTEALAEEVPIEWFGQYLEGRWAAGQFPREVRSMGIMFCLAEDATAEWRKRREAGAAERHAPAGSPLGAELAEVRRRLASGALAPSSRARLLEMEAGLAACAEVA